MAFVDLVAKLGLDIAGFNKGVDDANKSAGNLAERFEQVGQSLKTAISAAPLVALGAAAFKAASDFDDASDQIRFATGATGQVLQGLQQSFSEVFKGVPNDAAEVSRAIGDLNTRLGLTGKPLEDMATQFLNLARITGQQVGPLITDVTRLFGQWQIAIEDQSKSLDFLFKVSQATGIGVANLSQALTQAGPALRELGFSFEQSAALLGQFERAGVNAEKVVGSFQIALRNFAKAGVTDTTTALAKMIQAIKDAGSAGEANAIAIGTFGKSTIEIVTAVRSGKIAVDDMVQSIQASAETINRAANETKDFPELWKEIKHQIEEALVPLGNVIFNALPKLLDAIRPAINLLKEAGEWFGSLSPTVQAVGVAILGLAAAVPVAVAAFNLLAPLLAGTGAVLAAMTGPIGLVVLAVASLAAGIVYLKGKLDDTNDALAKSFKAEALQRDLQAAGISIRQGINEPLEEFIKRLEKAQTTILDTGELVKKFHVTFKDGKPAIEGSADAFEEWKKKTSGVFSVAKEIGLALDTTAVAARQAGAGFTDLGKQNEEAAKRSEKAWADGSRGITFNMGELRRSSDDLKKAVKALSAEFAALKPPEIGGHIKTDAEAAADAIQAFEVSMQALDAVLEANQRNLEKTGSAAQVFADGFKILGVTTEAAVEKQRQAAMKLLDTLYQVWIRLPEEQRRQMGLTERDFNIALDKIDEIGRKTEQHGEKVKKAKDAWQDFGRQVSTIVNDFAKNVTDAIFSIFGDEQNDKLRKQAAELQSSLDQRTRDWQAYTQEVATSLDAIAAKHAESLAREQQDVRDGLYEKEADYREYASNVAESLDEIRVKHAEQLARELGDLRDNLRDKAESYRQYVEDANKNLQRIGEDLADRVGDQQEQANRRIEDENKDFGRDVEDLNDRIRQAQIKGDKSLTASLQQQLRRRTEDHRIALQRIQADLRESVEDANRQAQRQTEDQKTQLNRRASEFAAYQVEIDEKTREAVNKHKTQQEQEEKDLNESLIKRRTALETYQADAAKKIDELAAKHAAAQASEVADVQAAMVKKKQEYDSYVTDTKAKLAELEEAHKGFWGRIVGAVGTSLSELGKGVIRTIIEQVFSPLQTAIDAFAKAAFKPITDALGGIVTAGVNWVGKMISEVFGPLLSHIKDVFAPGASKAIGGIVGGAAEGAGGVAGGAGGAAGGAAGGVLGAVGAVGAAVGAVSSVIGNFQMAGINKSLDLIENSTRFSKGYLLQIWEAVRDHLSGITEISHERFKPIYELLGFIHDQLKYDLPERLLGERGKPQDEGGNAPIAAAERPLTGAVFNEGIASLLSGIGKPLQQLAHVLARQLDKLGDNVQDGLKDLVPMSAIQDLTAAVRDGLDKVIEKMVAGTESLTAAISTAASSIVAAITAVTAPPPGFDEMQARRRLEASGLDPENISQALPNEVSAPITIRFEGFNSRDQAFAESILAQYTRRFKESGQVY